MVDDDVHVYTPPQYQKHHHDGALDIAHWRLEQARQLLDKFLGMTYAKNTTDDKRVAAAFFTLGEMTAVITMSDEAVIKKMAEKS